MRGKGFFITGTDTGVGKTWVTTRLLEKLRASGVDAVGMKPVECGGRGDSLAILAASGGPAAGLTLETINPIFLPEPLAPAAASTPPQIDLAEIRATCDTLLNRYEMVLVEGAGGWLVPLDHERTMADLAKALDLPVLLVAANRLGVLNHTLLTVSAIRESGLDCRGIYLNTPDETPDPSTATNRDILRKRLPDIAVHEGGLDGILAWL